MPGASVPGVVVPGAVVPGVVVPGASVPGVVVPGVEVSAGLEVTVIWTVSMTFPSASLTVTMMTEPGVAFSSTETVMEPFGFRVAVPGPSAFTVVPG